MSRIGNIPIAVPSGVKVSVSANTVTVEGKSKLDMPIPELVSVAVDNNEVVVSRKDESRKSGALQGLTRSLINNMVIGVTEGFKKELVVIGVGFRAQVTGNKLVMNLGYSHPIEYDIPKGITVTVGEGLRVSIEGADKQLVGEVAATIRRFRAPEPYKGKGIRYADERIVLKEGKSVG